MSGWGNGPWGTSPWGGRGLDALKLLRALAIRENVVRLWFNQAPKFVGNLEIGDADDSERYAVTPISTTTCANGLPPRAVLPASVARASIEGMFGSVIDLTVDRPLSPWPGKYVVACNRIQSINGLFLDPSATSKEFFGLSRGFLAPLADQVITGKDIANPQDGRDLIGQLNSSPLGTIPTDAMGDLAYDDGLSSYRKRVYRRCITRKGAFQHLPGYGVGLLDQVKRLSLPGMRDSIAADAEAQIKQEPETQSVRCWFVHDPTDGNLFWLKVIAVMLTNNKKVEIGVPFDATGG